jgi:hypothetical protein
MQQKTGWPENFYFGKLFLLCLILAYILVLASTFFLPKRKISIWFNDYYSSNSFLILYVANLYLRSVTETNIDKYINVHTCSTLFVLYMHIERF